MIGRCGRPVGAHRETGRETAGRLLEYVFRSDAMIRVFSARPNEKHIPVDNTRLTNNDHNNSFVLRLLLFSMDSFEKKVIGERDTYQQSVALEEQTPKRTPSK